MCTLPTPLILGQRSIPRGAQVGWAPAYWYLEHRVRVRVRSSPVREFGRSNETQCFVLFCFGWPLEPPPPGVGQLCRTLGRSRPAASLGRPGGPEWAQFVLIPYSLAGTALRPSWKGDTKRVPAILGSVGGPCRERVWPRTRPARRLKDRPRGLPDLLRSGSKLHISFFNFNFS